MKMIQYARIYGRFSSKPQERGDSKRRQIEGAVAYAAKHGLELVKEADGKPLVYFDEGVSGKAGLNLEKEFGRLLREAKAGETILCEATDRIGRQNPFLLGNLIYQTTQRGISIIAWQEGKVITPENIEEMGTQFSVFTGAAVGHQENQRKIKRQRETWAEKRKSGASEPLTATCPSWVKPIIALDERGNKITKGFELIPSHGAIVKRIFDLSLKGMGNTAIVKLFNDKDNKGTKVKPFGDSDGWHQSVVDRILKNRAVLGEFQPHEYKDRKRVPIGDPIPNYYPKVPGIDEKFFNAVQFKRKQRKIKGSGRRGDVVGNLFTTLAKCGFCNAPMTYTHKGYKYLVCDNSRRGKECRYCGYPYEEFETSFLNFVAELDLAKVLDPMNNPNNQLAVKIEQCRAGMSDTETRIENLSTAIEMCKDKSKMEGLVSRVEKLGEELQKQNQELNELLTEQAASVVNVVKVKELKQLITKAQNLTAPDANETRLALREAIRNLISKIAVFPYEIIAVDASKMSWREKREATAAGYTYMEDLQRVERCYRIHFKNEPNYRVIYSHPRYRLSRNLKYLVTKAA